MKHFADARRDARLAALQLLGQGIVGICAIWDLRGRLRVLLKLDEHTEAGAARQRADSAMAAAAEAFWSGEIWIWNKDCRETERQVYERAWREASAIPGAASGDARELDRHLSKGSWFGGPLRAPWPLNPHTPPIISFYSFKGGVGRTTALASFALQLARAHKRVCVVDLDLEAPGAGTLLAPQGASAAYGVVDYLLEAPLSGASAPDISDYYQEFDTARALGDAPPVAVMPAGAVDEYYLEKLARVDYERLVAAEAGAPSALTQMLAALRHEVSPEYVLIDARAGLHDLGGLALNGLAHLDVIFALDGVQSWAGLLTVVRHLGQTDAARPEPQPCALVHAMALPQEDPEWQVRQAQFTERAYDLFTGVYYDEAPPADDEEQPHYPCSIAFDERLQRARTLDDMLRAQRLFEGDYAAFFNWLLRKLGRTTP